MQKRNEIKELFKRYERGECSPEEEARLHAWLNHYATEEADGLDGTTLHKNAGLTKTVTWLRWTSYAAAAVLLLTFWYFKDSHRNDTTIQVTDHDTKDILLPDYNSAVLTLADGRQISLDEQSTGLALEESGVRITQTADGALIYEVSQPTKSDETAFNTFATPRGNTYSILLPDGTKVWLNASSSIRYPINFPATERRVSLSGEAYFEVSHNPDRPFYVDVQENTIQVLGTAFNVSAYKNENQVKTTLVEGSVQVSNGKHSLSLLPNQQATIHLSTQEITRSEVDTWSALAWKNGYFRFERASLEDIFVIISRWYGIQEVQYEGDFDNRFTGTFQRSKNISELFRYLEKIAPIRFEIEEGRVSVMK